jgi:hypothetical protein
MVVLMNRSRHFQAMSMSEISWTAIPKSSR